ncbi:MAG: protein-L-isoaspartate O-methyltransferase, partial [Thermoanaerobaculia bacterium]|nr:protein-L-isoaspartate O-methyltransferase [Thermoanaerobaculia bacterium]
VRHGDGWAGWPELAPFDGIVVTAASPRVPQPLLEQLRVGGKLVVPVGRFFQDLLVYTRTAEGYEKRNVIPVRFVPLTGEVEKPERPQN